MHSAHASEGSEAEQTIKYQKPILRSGFPTAPHLKENLPGFSRILHEGSAECLVPEALHLMSDLANGWQCLSSESYACVINALDFQEAATRDEVVHMRHSTANHALK